MFEPQANAVVAHRYRLLREIGRGGMGSVWEAVDQELDAPCALKFILNQSTKPPEVRARFMREARAVARLQSPHVVSIRSVGEWQEALYIAMELLVGETLFDRLARTGTLSSYETARVVDQIASVLSIAHRDGIVHRDLKPDNIWLWSQGELLVKLLDFGVAKHALDDGAFLKTATGTLVGTPYYMSPEQAAGDRHVDHRSDLWSLAIIAVQCLGGRLPFESTGLGQLLASIITGATPPIADLYPAAPPQLQQWWVRATSKDPSERYQSAHALADEFAMALSLRTVKAPLDGDGSPRHASQPPPSPAKADPRERLVATSSLSPVTARPVPTEVIDGAARSWVAGDIAGKLRHDQGAIEGGPPPNDASSADASMNGKPNVSPLAKPRSWLLAAAALAALAGGWLVWGVNNVPPPPPLNELASPSVTDEIPQPAAAFSPTIELSHDSLPSGAEPSTNDTLSATTGAPPPSPSANPPSASSARPVASTASRRPRPAPIPVATRRAPHVSPSPPIQSPPKARPQSKSSLEDRVGF